MSDFGIIKLSRAAAIDACCNGGRVFLLDLDGVEEVREIRYMLIGDIIDLDMRHTILYFEVVPNENWF